jgi:hypothetical protein
MKGSYIAEVITKALTIDLVTLEVLKDELDITGNERDVRLARWITQVSAYTANWCNRTLALETVREVWRAGDQPWLFDAYSHAPRPLTVRRWPIVKIGSVSVDGDTTLTAADYEIDADRGKIWRVHQDCLTRGWWTGTIADVTYSGGFRVPQETPPDLQQACLMLLKIRHDTISRDRMQQSYSIPGVIEERYWNPATSGAGAGMPPEIAEILNPYREHNT